MFDEPVHDAAIAEDPRDWIAEPGMVLTFYYDDIDTVLLAGRGASVFDRFGAGTRSYRRTLGQTRVEPRAACRS
ncbi:hypothetical protein GCM10010533_31640 [Mycolicibacterium pallens]